MCSLQGVSPLPAAFPPPPPGCSRTPPAIRRSTTRTVQHQASRARRVPDALCQAGQHVGQQKVRPRHAHAAGRQHPQQRAGKQPPRRPQQAVVGGKQDPEQRHVEQRGDEQRQEVGVGVGGLGSAGAEERAGGEGRQAEREQRRHELRVCRVGGSALVKA